jgi:hypothetical protein
MREQSVMSHIAIVKVRSVHDLEWNPSQTKKTLLIYYLRNSLRKNKRLSCLL